MVVRLQTADGKVRRFPTTYSEGERESGIPEKYATYCGMELKNAPKEHEECDHLDCAIHCAKQRKNESHQYFILYCVAAILLLIYNILMEGPFLPFLILGLTALPALWCLIDELRAGKRFKELTEYKDLGTISGIKAYQIGPPVMLRLQTEDGKIRLYQPAYGLGTPIDHLECRMRLLRNWRRKEMAGYFFMAIAAIFLPITAIANTKGSIDLESDSLMILVSSTILAICFLTWGRDEKSRLDELNEFKNNGTIKGIKACQIFDDPKS